MDLELRQMLASVVIGWADDELLLGHRDSEWTGHGPILEEDIALTNLALDELGHAQLLYQVAAELEQADRETYPDELVFSREAPSWRNLQLVELPCGDWAFTIVRRFLHDSIETRRWRALSESRYGPLRDVAAKIGSEEPYHIRFSESRLRRLALGTEESRDRTQSAVTQLWPLAAQAFAAKPEERAQEESGLIPSAARMAAEFQEEVGALMQGLGLTLPESSAHIPERTDHTEHLVSLLDELQRVARAYQGAPW